MLIPIILALALSLVNAQSQLARTEIGQPRATAEEYLLPSNIVPFLYQLELEPNFETDTFNGSVTISIVVRSAANSIVLHTNQLEVNAASINLLNEEGNVVNTVTETSYSNDDRHFYTITFEEELTEGELYILVINSFTGILNEQNNGFYLARYTDENGVERKLATTQFEATSARRAFPCFDEPALKAEFEVTIIRTADYDSISNTPKASVDEVSEGRFQDRFARTVPMSTYLVAFIISDFTYVADLNHRIYLRPSLIANNKADYALETGIGVLKAIEEFVNVTYTLEKMDQVGLPDGYFSAGAMENWGLVTYREVYLTYTNLVTASNYIQNTATIISHEFGHQWFGNLVSPAWWSYIWLNEGFATYFEYYGASVVAEDMDLMDQIVILTVQYALRIDSTTSTRPMNQDVGSPRDISSVFDSVAYDKSGSVIRMVEGILSTEVFRRGLNIYLNKMQFQAAQPEDLYTSWQEALDETGANPLPDGNDVSSVLSTWDSNAGYPLVTVNRNYSDGTVTFSQRRFITTNPDNDDESIWYVPISYTTGNNIDFSKLTPKLWLTTRRSDIDLDDLSVDDWLLVNIQETGYYRVNYDNENWLRIITFLNSENFDQVHKLNRAQLLDDSFYLARYGVTDFSIPLFISQYFARETDYIPLYTFVNFIYFLDTYMANSDIHPTFAGYVKDTLEIASQAVGFDENEDDDHITKLNRINIMTCSTRFGRQDWREYALGRIREWQESEENIIVPNMQTPLTCAGLKIGEQSDWDFVFQRYANEQDSLVRRRLLNALGCNENEDILNGFMDIILDSSSQLATSDRLTALSSIYSSSRENRNYLYAYIKYNWTTVASSLSTQVTSLLNGLAATFTTQEQYDDLESFGEEVGVSVNNALRTIQSNIAWADQYMPTILDWFAENVEDRG